MNTVKAINNVPGAVWGQLNFQLTEKETNGNKRNKGKAEIKLLPTKDEGVPTSLNEKPDTSNDAATIARKCHIHSLRTINDVLGVVELPGKRKLWK